MKDFLSTRRIRAVLLACGAVGLATLAPVASAVRVGGAPAPTASAVQGAAQEPAHAQADESTSLRLGTIGAVDERAARVRVQGIWIDLLPGKTQLLRNGQPAGLETLRPGEAIRYTVVTGNGAVPAMKVIYAP